LSTLDFERNAAFHDRLAPQYESHLSGAANTLARRAFQELVTRYIPAGGLLLDFGCGTGLDAQVYARQGYRVLAYDNSPGMVAQLRSRCQTEIAAGMVTPYSMGYREFLADLPRRPTPDAATADFAVLNSIRDLGPLFETVGRHLAPGGWFLVSLLNPLHWSKIKTRGWWRDALRSPRGPRLHTAEPYASYLHFVPEVLCAARNFRLVGRANAGAVVRYDALGSRPLYWTGQTSASTSASASAERLWHTPIYKLLGHFVFLVLRRSP
jgi:SAM-dependent methyltransferase